MALAKKCDVCGTLYECYGDIRDYEPNGISFIHGSNECDEYQDLTPLDLCPKCLRNVQDLLRGIGYKDEE